MARIEHASRGFTLTGRSLLVVLRCVLAFLLRNDLLGRRWLFFTDGQRSLQNSIVTFFAWHRCTSLILDWFHVGKKCREELSLALKGREVRNRHLKQIVRLLWYGLVAEAVEYVRSIPPGDIKSRSSLDRLIGYFERNRRWIPCYALRRSLGLPNSSNPAVDALELGVAVGVLLAFARLPIGLQTVALPLQKLAHLGAADAEAHGISIIDG